MWRRWQPSGYHKDATTVFQRTSRCYIWGSCICRPAQFRVRTVLCFWAYPEVAQICYNPVQDRPCSIQTPPQESSNCLYFRVSAFSSERRLRLSACCTLQDVCLDALVASANGRLLRFTLTQIDEMASGMGTDLHTQTLVKIGACDDEGCADIRPPSPLPPAPVWLNTSE